MSKEAELSDWLASMGAAQQFSSQDIESGKTVASILQAVDRNTKIQLQDGNSAIVRVSNWNSITDHLKTLGVKLTQEEKSKIINGNHDLVFNVISKLRELHDKSTKETEINLKDIDPKKEVKEAESLLQLFLLGIIKHFSLSPKEALSLLSNDSKYLAHILAKGLKGDFRPIDNLILEFAKNLQKIVSFSKNKDNELFFMKSVKPALISKSESVAENSLNLILAFLENYDKDTRIKMIREHLTPTLMLIIRRHPQLTDKVVQNVLESGQYNQSLLSDMYENTSKNDLTMFFLALWKGFRKNDKKQAFEESLVFQKLMDHITSGIKDPQNTLSSLECCLELASDDFDIFDRYCGQKMINSIRDIFLTKETQNIELIHLYFAFLSLTGDRKHPLAPIFFKILSSRLATAGENQYDVLMAGFSQTLEEIPSIPPTAVMESLSQRPDLKIEQLQLSLFIKMLAVGADARVAVSIYNFVSRSFVEETGLGKNLVNLLIQIIGSFHQEEILIDMTGKLIKVCLALYFADAKKMSQKRKPLSYKTKLEGEEATSKLKMIEIEYFLRKVIELENKDINPAVEPLLCFSCLQLAALGKEHSKGLQKIVALLGDPGKLISKYEKELGIDTGNSSQLQNKSRVKHTSPENPHERSSPQYDTPTQSASNFVKSTQKKSPLQLHPMSLSMMSVKNDAFLGLQKYTKIFQKKTLAQQSKRYQDLMKEQDKQKLKKAYQSKMALEKGFKFRGVSEKDVTYLFQFDTKEIYAQSNHLALNFYNSQAEEERDAQGVDQFIRRYEKVMKLYFNNYCGKKQGFHTKYFDQILDRTNLVHSSAVYKMLKDHGLESYITPKEVQILARRVNYHLNSTKDDPELLDFEAFKSMMVQISFTMFTRPPKDLRGRPVGDMLEQLFSTFKLYASENRVNPQLFEDPEAQYTGQAQAIRLLNRRLQQNSDYILPQGYKKITETRVFFDHKIYLQAMSPTYKQVYQVLDEILFEGLKFHIIEPFTQELKIARARPNVYALDWAKLSEVQQKHLPISFKKEVAKFPMKERPLAKEVATVLADIVHAVELNHDEIGLKHENPLIKNKKQKEEEIKRAREVAETKRLNATRQLKSAMETQKETREQKMKQKEEEREEELRRKREDKERRERRQKELKQKLEQYNQKKKEEQESKKSIEQQKIEKERQFAEKKKKDLQKTKQRIQELKQQKQAEQKQKHQRMKEEEKKKREEERKKLQRSQIERKQKIQEYKSKKKGGQTTTKALDAPEEGEEEKS